MPVSVMKALKSHLQARPKSERSESKKPPKRNKPCCLYYVLAKALLISKYADECLMLCQKRSDVCDCVGVNMYLFIKHSNV